MAVGSLGDSLIKIGESLLNYLVYAALLQDDMFLGIDCMQKWSAIALQQRRILHEGCLTKQPMQRTFTSIVMMVIDSGIPGKMSDFIHEPMYKFFVM